jgi:ElaB/YqjD/DUF883 family membrane-anchored ribosome-binding protein
LSAEGEKKMLETSDDRIQGVGDTPRSAEEIRNDIELKKQMISETVDRLNERLHERVDWRSYIRRHPFLAIGVAASLGFLVSGKLVRPETPVEKIADAIDHLSGKAKEESFIKLILYGVATKIVTDLLKSGSVKQMLSERPDRLTGDIAAPRTEWNNVH